MYLETAEIKRKGSQHASESLVLTLSTHPAVSLCCCLLSPELRGWVMSLLWGAGALLSRVESVLEARERTAAGAQKWPDWPPLHGPTPTPAQPGRRNRGPGPVLQAFFPSPPPTPCRCEDQSPVMNFPCSAVMTPGPWLTLWAGEPRTKGLTQPHFRSLQRCV